MDSLERIFAQQFDSAAHNIDFLNFIQIFLFHVQIKHKHVFADFGDILRNIHLLQSITVGKTLVRQYRYFGVLIDVYRFQITARKSMRRQFF